MKRRGNKKRTVIHEDGSSQILSLKRYYCEKCNTLHSEIPDIIIPYKQYDRATIEKVRNGDTSFFTGDDITIRRWQKI